MRTLFHDNIAHLWRSLCSIGSRDGGFELVEIVVATGIISLSLVSVIFIASQSLVISHRSLDTYVASTVLQDGVEAVRTIRDSGWSNISGLTAGVTYYPAFDTSTNTWALTTNPSDGTVGIYTRSVTVGDVLRDSGTSEISTSGDPDANTRLVTVTVAWTTSDGQTISRPISLYIMNIF